jgi:acetoin utilization deacetylase AcuC-like enzyme
MDPSRPDKVMAFLMDEGLARRHDVSRPLAASLENILRVHSTAYVESLADPTVVGDIMGLELGLRDAQAVLDVARLMVGGTIQATRLALRTGKTAVHLGGGLHHAMPDEGMGFCVFNDVAVAIARLRARGFAEPVLVVDLDIHDGNGTRAAFAHDPTVYTFSIHNTPWDEAEAVASTSLALGSDVTDGVFLDALTETLPPVVAQHRPGLVVYVAGVDGAASDALGDWKLSTDGLLARDRFVVETVRKDDASVPIVAVLAGGYGQSAWRYTARFVAWLITGQAVEPPDAAEIIVRRFRELSRQWQIEETMERDESDWGLTADDLLGLVTREDTRFLGRFSRHAVEFQLEQLGVLDNMRRRGFDELRLSLDAPKGLGQVLRIHGAPDERGLLMELKASRSRSIVPGFEVIEIEWLLLQNPRASFSDRRPQLPGQSHPGLGMLRDMAAWLIVVSEKMRLDGIAFVPSQFYMAAVGRRHLKFVSPEAQGRYEAIREVLKDLSLGSANRALIEGVVVDGESGRPVSWEPVPMVLPVSSRLRAEISSTRYRERAASTRASLQFRRRET